MKSLSIVYSAFMVFWTIGIGSAYAQFSDTSNSEFLPYIEQAYNNKIISGYSDATFRPNNTVTFIESLKIITNAGPRKELVTSFVTDFDTHWSEPFKALFNLRDDTYVKKFTDNENITRDFAVYLMLRQLGIELGKKDIASIPASFSDIDSNTTFAPYILFAKYAWISNGFPDGTFWPLKKVSRGELTKMAWRTLRENTKSIDEKYKALTGIKTSLRPGDTATIEYMVRDNSATGSVIQQATVVVGGEDSILPRAVTNGIIGLYDNETGLYRSDDPHNTCSRLTESDTYLLLKNISLHLPRSILESSYSTTLKRGEIGQYINGVFSPSRDIRVGEAVEFFGGNSILSYLTHGYGWFSIQWKVTKIDGDSVTVFIEKNEQSPFYGKELSVGLKAVVRDFQYWTIKQLSSDSATVDISNPDGKVNDITELFPGQIIKEYLGYEIVIRNNPFNLNTYSYSKFGSSDACKDKKYYLVHILSHK